VRGVGSSNLPVPTIQINKIKQIPHRAAFSSS
jgi:hypothetical protein